MFTPPAGVNPSALPPTRKKRRIPRSGRPAAMKAAQGLGWIFLYLKFSSWYSSSLVLGPTYLTYSFVHRVFVLYLFGFTTRLKYYGVWTLTEGACILSGLGYSGINPQTGRYNWSRLQNVAPYPLETAQNTRAYLDAWNQNTNAWLKNYIYLRVTPKGSKPGFGATMATFITSAFWHGFYPGYYLAFILAAFLQTVAKTFRRSIRPFFLVPGSSSIPLRSKKYYDFASYLTTQLAFSFTVSAFILLDFSSCMIVWTRVYWYTPIGVALSMAFFATPAVKVEIAKRLKARAARAPPKTVPPASMSSSSIANTPATIPSSAEGLLRLDLSRTSSINTDAGDGTPGSGGYAYSGALGVPGDPEQFVDDAVREARAQVEEVRRRQKQQRQQGQKEGSSKGDGGIGGMVGDGS
jgi:lysophospholipid acyltransferase